MPVAAATQAPPQTSVSQSAALASKSSLSTNTVQGKTAGGQIDGGSADKNNALAETIQQQHPKHEPPLLAWVGFNAGFQAFRVAEHQESCALASDAAEPAADPDLGRVLRSSEAGANSSKPSSDTEKQRTPWRYVSHALRNAERSNQLRLLVE